MVKPKVLALSEELENDFVCLSFALVGCHGVANAGLSGQDSCHPLVFLIGTPYCAYYHMLYVDARVKTLCVCVCVWVWDWVGRG